MKTLRFHTGRGGRFHNPGHVTFVDFEDIQNSKVWEPYFQTPSSSTGWMDESGNELDCQINNDGTGYISDDGDYNSDYFVKEDQLRETQINALIKAKDQHWNTEEIERVLNKHYSFYL